MVVITSTSGANNHWLSAEIQAIVFIYTYIQYIPYLAFPNPEWITIYERDIICWHNLVRVTSRDRRTPPLEQISSIVSSLQAITAQTFTYIFQ